jgi:hypothetical protein
LPSASEAQGLSDPGAIYADTQRAAEQEAFKLFSASSEMAKRKIYVRQHP